MPSQGGWSLRPGSFLLEHVPLWDRYWLAQVDNGVLVPYSFGQGRWLGMFSYNFKNNIGTFLLK